MLICAAFKVGLLCTLFCFPLFIILIYRVLSSTLFYHLYFKQTFFFSSLFFGAQEYLISLAIPLICVNVLNVFVTLLLLIKNK